MDALSDILDLLQLRGTLYFHTEFSPPWSVAVPAYGRTARFHLVVRGRCHVLVGDGHEVACEAGDLIVIPNGAAHVLCDSPGSPPSALDDVLERSGYRGDGVLVYGGEGRGDAETRMICGHLSFAGEHPLLRALPAYLLVGAGLRARRPWLDDLMRLMTTRMFTGSPGTAASMIRLSEALFIEVIQACAEQDGALRGIVEALADARIGRALGLMHRQLGADWTLQRIAREVGMSRSRFASRFQALMGCSPMAYLSEVRLQTARHLLARSGDPIQRVAARVGYQSAAAFSRAFASRYGQSPREARRAAA